MRQALLTAMVAAAAAGATATEYRAQVVVARNQRLYFHDRPSPCPPSGPCAWRRKEYLVAGDRVQERATANGFSQVVHIRYEEAAPGVYQEVDRSTGWVLSDGLCLYPPPRATRDEPIPVLKVPGRKPCPMQGVTRTVDDDEAFYNGTFRSQAASLVVTDAGPADLSFALKVARDDCHLEQSGKAEARRDSVFGHAGPGTEGCSLTVAFTDQGADLELFGCGVYACEGIKERLLWRDRP